MPHDVHDARGERRRELVIAPHADQLLDEIVLQREIAPEARHVDLEVPPLLPRREPEAGEDRPRLRPRRDHPEHALDARHPQADPPWRAAPRVGVHQAARDNAPSELRDERCGARRGVHEGLDVGAALEAVRRVGLEAERPGGASDRDRAEPGALEEDAGGPASFNTIFGARRRAPVSAASSRATPRTDRQSGRFGVTSTSRTWSSRPRCATRSRPSGASPSRTRIPSSGSGPNPSSRSEHSIPWDGTPRIVAVSTRRWPGSTAPGGARAARTPTFVLGAPQITENFWDPVETRQRRRRWPWLSPSSRSIASLSPTTTPRTSGASGVTAATSIPAFVRRSAASAGDSRRSTNSWSHLYGIFMVTGAAGPAHFVGGLRKARRGSVRPRPVA